MRKWISILLMSYLLAGCGAKFVYHNMDWFITDYLEDYVTLTDHQESLVKKQINMLSHWHQNEELDNYIIQLDQLLAMDPKTLTVEQLQHHRDWIQAHYQSLVTKIFPSIYLLASDLSETQVDEFIQGVEERHQKYADKYADLSENETRAKYQQRITERMEQWLGDLTREQIQLVNQWARALQLTTQDWVAFQSQLRVEINTLLNQRNNQEVFNKHLSHLLFTPEDFYSPVLKAKLNYNQQTSNEYIVKIVHLSTKKQIDHFKQTVQEWRNLAADLSPLKISQSSFRTQ